MKYCTTSSPEQYPFTVTSWKHLQFRDNRMDSRGAGGPDSEIFRFQIVRRLKETFIVNENEVFIGFGASGVNP